MPRELLSTYSSKSREWEFRMHSHSGKQPPSTSGDCHILGIGRHIVLNVLNSQAYEKGIQHMNNQRHNA
ncbi:hypothetical protein UY3_09792 [Chelonia mydas]|uniref:Uncharacterized protein n=1 Tax=Chelonia mydas TaxID=8469 RepID=M7BBX6_CHEMY|nr:hypothetical protein UY3_09792 [Chelonia mydas]